MANLSGFGAFLPLTIIFFSLSPLGEVLSFDCSRTVSQIKLYVVMPPITTAHHKSLCIRLRQWMVWSFQHLHYIIFSHSIAYC